MRLLWWVVSLGCLAGCASTYTPLPVTPFTDPAPVPPAVVSPVDPPFERWPVVAPSANPMKVIDSANSVSLVEPNASGFRRSRIEFSYQEGAVYRIDTAVERPTTITFGPKEEWKYTSLAGERWQIDEITNTVPQRIIISPKEPNLRTLVTIVTSIRAYHLDLRSNAKTGLVSVSWEQPLKPVAQDVASGQFGLGYGISSGSFTWRPIFVWDDRLHLYLLFADTLPSGDAPVIAVMSRGQRQLINYRLHGRIARVDRVPDLNESLELRVGIDDSARLEVRKADNYRFVTCPGEDVCSFLSGWLWREADVASSH